MNASTPMDPTSQPRRSILVRLAAASLVTGALAGAGAIFLVSVIAVLGPGMAVHGAHGRDEFLGPLLPLAVLACLPVLMFRAGVAMWKFKPWGRTGGRIAAGTLLGLLVAATIVALNLDFLSKGPLGYFLDPAHGGSGLMGLLLPFGLMAQVPILLLVATGIMAVWPVSVYLILNTASARNAFAPAPGTTGSNPPPIVG